MASGPESAAAGRLAALAARFGLPDDALARLSALTHALRAEPDPPTTVRDPAAVVDRHLADSLVALELPPVREARRIVDIGAGAGFPGLPLAVALPAATVDLIEATRRKCAVIDRFIAAARVRNARSVPERVETWGGGRGREVYDVATARAVGSLPVVAEYAAPLLIVGGTLVVWRGRRDQVEERAGAAAARRLGLAVEDVARVTPFEVARDRHLHVFVKRDPTPPGYPRRPGAAAKRPLG